MTDNRDPNRRQEDKRTPLNEERGSKIDKSYTTSHLEDRLNGGRPNNGGSTSQDNRKNS